MSKCGAVIILYGRSPMLRCQTGEATRSEYQNRKKLAGEEVEACVQESRREEAGDK
jgi:hypothetical protein